MITPDGSGQSRLSQPPPEAGWDRPDALLFVPPALHSAASRSAELAERRFLFSTKVQLAALTLAALCGSFTLRGGAHGADWAGLAAAAAFTIAGSFRARSLAMRLEQVWYESRAVAESAKTLAWRYAVGGEPFPVDMAPDEADTVMAARLRELPDGLSIAAVPAPAPNSSQITDTMRAFRAEPLDVRRRAYLTDRVRDQQNWYSRKSADNARTADRWNVALLVLEIAAVLGALLRGSGLIEFDLFGFVATILAAFAAWTQSKKYGVLASSYAIASHELAGVGDRLSSVVDEPTWASFVQSAEEAISREHTMWKASR